MRYIDADQFGVLDLGRQWEHDRTTIVFDIADIQAEFPNGLVQIAHKRPRDSAAHFVSGVTVNGSTVSWLVDIYELQNQGEGQVTLVYATGEHTARRKLWKSAVCRSIHATASVPPDWQDVLDDLLEAAGSVHVYLEQTEDAMDSAITAKNAAEAAQLGAEASQNAAETAQTSAEENALKAEGYTVGKQDGESVQPGSPYYQNNAKHYATVAQQGAEESGYAWFDVHQDDGEMYVTITENLAADVSFRVNTSNGTLEVVL